MCHFCEDHRARADHAREIAGKASNEIERDYQLELVAIHERALAGFQRLHETEQR